MPQLSLQPLAAALHEHCQLQVCCPQAERHRNVASGPAARLPVRARRPMEPCCQANQSNACPQGHSSSSSKPGVLSSLLRISASPGSVKAPAAEKGPVGPTRRTSTGQSQRPIKTPQSQCPTYSPDPRWSTHWVDLAAMAEADGGAWRRRGWGSGADDHRAVTGPLARARAFASNAPSPLEVARQPPFRRAAAAAARRQGTA